MQGGIKANMLLYFSRHVSNNSRYNKKGQNGKKHKPDNEDGGIVRTLESG
jgi:hypothetical protein